MTTKLVSISTSKDGTIYMSRFFGKKFDMEVNFNLKEVGTKQDLLEVVEDFRVNGLPGVA